MMSRSWVAKKAKMMRSPRRRSDAEDDRPSGRWSAGSPAAAMPTTTALSPASTRSIMMTVARAVSSEANTGSMVPSGRFVVSAEYRLSRRHGRGRRDQLLGLEVAPQRGRNSSSIQAMIWFSSSADRGQDRARDERMGERKLERRRLQGTRRGHRRPARSP